MGQAKQTEELMLRLEVKLLTFVDPFYPPGVNIFANQPAVLYYKGTLRPPQTSVGIVGSRHCAAYGKQVAAEAAAFLAQQGITVVELLSLLCSMELEGHVMISGHTVRATNNHTEFSQ